MLHPLCTHSAKTDTCLVRVQDPPTSSSGFYFEYSSNKTHIWASYFHSMLLSHSSPLKNYSICFSKCFSLFILQSSQNKLKLLTLIVFSWFGHFTSVILSFERANSAQSSCLLSLWKWLVSDVVEHRGPLGLFNNNKKILLFKLKKKIRHIDMSYGLAPQMADTWACFPSILPLLGLFFSMYWSYHPSWNLEKDFLFLNTI